MKKFNLLFLLLIIIGFFSCEKNGPEMTVNPECSNMLYFKNMDEFNSELQNILSLNLDEKAQWVEQKGFNSIGVAAEEFYKTIDPESFNSFEEVEEFVKQNDQFIQLIKENGEYSIQTKFYNNPLRFFINEDQIFQVGERVYKLIEVGLISGDIQNLGKIKEITNLNYLQFTDDTDIYINEKKTSITKSVACENGDSGTSEKILTGGKYYRTNIELTPVYYNDSYWGTIARSYYRVSCQVRTLGIWWAHETTIYADINAQFVYDHVSLGTRTVDHVTTYQSTQLTTYIEGIHDELSSVYTGWDPNSRYSSYYAEGHTDAGIGPNGEGQIIIQCD